MNRLRQGLRWLFRRDRMDRDIQREMRFHIDRETERRVAGGMRPDEARRSAMRDFGGVGATREAVRDVRGLTFWESLSQDIRFGLRTLARTPGYTVAVVLTLALGIGANAAMFSVIDGVLIKPLPFRNGQELVLLQESALGSNLPQVGVSIPELYDYRQRLHTVQGLVEHHAMSFILLNQGEPDRVNTGVVSANFFDMLGVKPQYGRTFRPADDELGADAVLVLSHAYWQSKFGGDPNVIGRVLQMNDRPHTVIGVLPDFPQYPVDEDVYMSTSACPYRANAQRNIPTLGFRAFGAL